MQCMAHFVGVSLEHGSSARLAVEEGLLDGGVDAFYCPGDSIARWIGTVI